MTAAAYLLILVVAALPVAAAIHWRARLTTTQWLLAGIAGLLCILIGVTAHSLVFSEIGLLATLAGVTGVIARTAASGQSVKS